jgi:hypothetical protein
MDGAPSWFVTSTAGAMGARLSARDALAFNHETSAAETIPCGTDGSVRRHHGRNIANWAQHTFTSLLLKLRSLDPVRRKRRGIGAWRQEFL